MQTDQVKTQIIEFENNNQATAVFANFKTKAEDIISALGIDDYRSVILSIGSADSLEQKNKDKLTQLFSRGIARGAIEGTAVLVDGGTQSGVMELLGEGVAARGNKTPLIGVAPVGKITYPGVSAEGVPLDPNHSHFVLVDGMDWGSETSTMFKLVKTLSTKISDSATTSANQGKKAIDKVTTLPSLVILTGGGEVTKKEVLRAVRQNFKIIVIEESGGVADEIALAWKNKNASTDEPILAEILSDGDLYFYKLSSSVKGIERLIVRELGVDKVLMQAWETFAVYDQNANFHQKRFSNLQIIILALGVVGTALVIVQEVFRPRREGKVLSPAELKDAGYIFWWILHNALILMPIVLSVLVTAAARFKQGSKWLLLRAGAESIKREIFRYRTRSMYYKELAEQQLALKIEDITRRTMRTEINASSLKPYDIAKGLPPKMYASGGSDDGVSFLAPDRYIEVRLDDQLNFFRSKSVKLEKQLSLLYWLTFAIGGLGSFLAAINLQIWVALTTTIVAAFGTFLGYRQTESTLIKYNQAATDLANVKAWWNALSAEEQAQVVNIDSLVVHTEQVLQSELDGWIQQMQNALADLREDQKKKYEKEPATSSNAQDGPAVSPNAAPPVQPVTVEAVAPTVHTESEVEMAKQTESETEQPTENQPAPNTEEIIPDEQGQDFEENAAGTVVSTQLGDGDAEKDRTEIEISSTSPAELIGEIEEIIPDGTGIKIK
jgi:hypothetical protein